MTMEIAVKRLDPRATMPTQGNPGDAGYDLRTLDGYWLQPGERETFDTGIAVAIPGGYAGIIKPRSGLAARHGLNVLAGVIDSGYRGRIGVVLHNTSRNLGYEVSEGERIAQLLIVPVQSVDFHDVDVLPEAVRGEGGFGSTGAL